MLGALLSAAILNVGQAGPNGATTIVVPSRAPIIQALFNPDGRRVYFATHAGIEAHDLETGKRLFDAPHGRTLFCSPHGDLLAAVSINIGMISVDGFVAVVDATNGKTVRTFPGTSALFSPDSRWVIAHTGYTWGQPAKDEPPGVQIIDLRTGKVHPGQLPGGKGAGPGILRGPGSGFFHFTRDSKILVSRSRDQFGKFTTVAGFDLETGKAVEKLPRDEDIVVPHDPATSADRTRFVDAWSVFDVASGKTIAKFELPKTPKADGWRPMFQISADGKTVYTVTSSRRELKEDAKTGRTSLTMASHLHSWDAETGKWIRIAAEARRTVLMPSVALKKLGRFHESEPQFAINPQGTLAIDYDLETVTVWDLKTGKAVRNLRTSGQTFRPEILRFSPEGQWIATASTDGSVALWNSRTGEAGQRLDRVAHLGDVCFRPKSNELVGVSHGYLVAWDLKTGDVSRTFEHKGNLFRIACHPEGKLAAFSDHWSEHVTLIDLDKGASVHHLAGGKAAALAFHPDGSLLTLDAAGNVTHWDTATGKQRARWPSGNAANYRYAARNLAFLPGAEQFLVCENTGVALLKTKTGKRIAEHPIKNAVRDEPRGIDVHPDGTRFVVYFGGQHDAEERDLKTGKLLRVYPGYLHGTTAARYHPDGTRVATAGTYSYELRIHAVPRRTDE